MCLPIGYCSHLSTIFRTVIGATSKRYDPVVRTNTFNMLISLLTSTVLNPQCSLLDQLSVDLASDAFVIGFLEDMQFMSLPVHRSVVDLFPCLSPAATGALCGRISKLCTSSWYIIRLDEISQADGWWWEETLCSESCLSGIICPWW